MDHPAIHTGTISVAYAACAILISFALWRVPAVARTAPLGVIQVFVAVVMGPAVFGVWAPGLRGLMASFSQASFEAVGWLAIALFTFVTGGHSKVLEGWNDSRRTIAVAVSSFSVPLAFGALLGAWLYGNYPDLIGPSATRWTFSVAIGICVSITAVPVLAIVLGDLKLLGTDIGRTAFAMAIFGDVGLWIALSVVITAAHGASGGGSTAGAVAAGAVLFAVAMITVVRPLVRRLADTVTLTDGSALTLSFALMTMSGIVTEWIGLHFAIGSFLAGAIVPNKLFVRVARTVEPLCLYITLPFFFLSVSANMNTVSASGAFWPCFLSVTAVAAVTKFISAGGPYLLSGEGLWESGLLGTLAQCKGLMEIVGMKILFDANVISADCLAPLVAMAIFTTVSCKPLGCLFLRRASKGIEAPLAVPAE